MTSRFAVFALLWVLPLTACNISRVARTPTPLLETIAPVVTQPAAATPSSTATSPPTLAPSPSPPPAAATAGARGTSTQPPQMPSPAPSPTSPWFTYDVRGDDTMFYILQLPQHGFGYDAAVAATVVALNDNIANMDMLPVGQTILIPRPTVTATAAGASETQALLATIGVDDSSGALLPAGAHTGCYEALGLDTMVSIAEAYDTTLEVLSRLNQDINWFGCAFNQPSGGPDCNPVLQIGQCVTVPLPTPRPSMTPSPSGDETATPTATHRAPRLLQPVDGARVTENAPRLHWVGNAGMSQDDTYLVEIVDQTTNASLRQISHSTAFALPAAFAPSDGQPHLMQWRVSVARANAAGVYAFVGAAGDWRAFTWDLTGSA